MSANSPRHVSRCVPIVVQPQAVNDRSIYDSVAGFIDVALASTPQTDPKDSILWVKFENTADISDLSYGDDWDLEGRAPPPLLLILGYVTGIQVWAVPANGEAFEVLSWRHGSVKTLRILPSPLTNDTELADEPIDQYAHKRPLMAICDNSTSSSGSGMQYCSINFLSLKSKEQVKSIKFNNPIIDIIANRSSVAVTFPEKIAVFDARTLEDRLTITACHPSPGLNPNPVALGPRWMAYAERRLIPSKRSSGGCDYDGVTSYTATVLNAAKSLGKGLRELGETMAAGFSSASSYGTQGHSNFSGTTQNSGEKRQPGVITILDIKYPITDSSPVSGAPLSSNGDDRIVAHFIAHSDAVVAMDFDYSGMLLITADKRGHDFHVFRIHAHPGGPSMSAVHHLYVLHRGDTTSKVQDICFSLDSRWVAVSTLRGTTHVFPITPYGGPAGVRTHGSSHVVNRLSRFHRSAGLSIDSRSSSPILHSDYSLTQTTSAYPNPRTPPFPHPTVVNPLAQLRQPLNITSNSIGSSSSFNKSGRQRVSSLSDDITKPLRVCGTFARPRAWLLEPGTPRESTVNKIQNKTIDSLFIVTAYGNLLQYDLDPKPISNIPKEKVCDDTPIELDIEPKAQWNLLRHDDSIEIQPPLPPDNLLLKERLNDGLCYADDHIERNDQRDALWLAQVEIITHAGPHRRLWMGPQFMFKTYNTPSGSSLSAIESESVEIGTGTTGNRPVRSNPVNMPTTNITHRPGVSVLIESSSYSSIEQSPRLTQIDYDSIENNFSLGSGDNQLREDLADAMREPLGNSLIEATGSNEHSSSLTSCQNNESPISTSPGTSVRNNNPVSIAKLVNPLGTVTTVVKSNKDSEIDQLSELEYTSDHYVHENCDEALFRPVVTVVGSKESPTTDKEICYDRPAPIGLDLIVPVIEERNTQTHTTKKIKIQDTTIIKKENDKINENLNKTNTEKINSEENLIENIEVSLNETKEKKKSKVSENQIDEKSLKIKTEEIIKEETPNVSENINVTLTVKTKKSLKNVKNEINIDKEIEMIDGNVEQKKSVNKKKKKQKETISPSELKPPSPLSEIISNEKSSYNLNNDDFPDLNQINDHFSIQENLTKNSDFIIQTHRYNESLDEFTPIEPLFDVNIDEIKDCTKYEDHDDDDFKLDFNILKMDDIDVVVEQNERDKNSTCDYNNLIVKECMLNVENLKKELNCDEEEENLKDFIFPETNLPPFIDEKFNYNYNTENDSELMNFESPDKDDEKSNEFHEINNEPILIIKSNSNSSDETEDSFNEKKPEKLDNNDDEELQPLISTATTSSETTPNCSKGIFDSLPENQKDEIKQQQNNNNNNNNIYTIKKRKNRRKR